MAVTKPKAARGRFSVSFRPIEKRSYELRIAQIAGPMNPPARQTNAFM
jgi:hypothetical protein